MLINPKKIKQKNKIIIDANTPPLSMIKNNNRIKKKRLIKEIIKGNKINNKIQSTRKRENIIKHKTKN